MGMVLTKLTTQLSSYLMSSVDFLKQHNFEAHRLLDLAPDDFLID